MDRFQRIMRAKGISNDEDIRNILENDGESSTPSSAAVLVRPPGRVKPQKPNKRLTEICTTEKTREREEKKGESFSRKRK